jgi:membrane-bound inhibitor of C-type lysozyme
MMRRRALLILAGCVAVLALRPGLAANGQGAGSSLVLKSPVASTGPFVWACDGVRDTTIATFYKTEPGLLVLVRGTETRVAFTVLSGSGSRYVGDRVSYWEARGETTINWSGREERCRRSP